MGDKVVGCARVEEICGRWERGEELSPDDLSGLRDHVAECPGCSSRYGALLPFIERDALGHSIEAPRPASRRFTDAVMERLARSPAQTAHARRVAVRSFPRWALPAAALLALAIGVGIGVRIYSSRRDSPEALVRFELAAPEARSVSLVGSFSDWEASRLLMTDEDGDGVWEITIRLRRNETYTYNFLIDGTLWTPDPSAPAQIDDGFGGISSVMKL